MIYRLADAKRIELEQARREGREILEWGVTFDAFKAGCGKKRWPVGSTWKMYNEAIAGPPNDARTNHPGTEARQGSPRPFVEPEGERT